MKPWKLILAFLVVFAAGAVTGGFTAGRFFHGPFRSPPGATQIADHVMRDFKNDVDLKPEQTPQIREIVFRHAEELVALHRDLATRMRATIAESDREVTALLDEKQKAQFEKMRANRPPLGHEH
jgi:Spy/CpxP family protein refolding chaperone